MQNKYQDEPIPSRNGLTSPADSGKMEQKEIERIRTEVIPKQKTDTIMPRQDIHRQGTKMYQQRQHDLQRKNQYGPGYITISDEEILRLVEMFKGTGEIKLSRKKKEWTRQETILGNDKVIGVAVNNLTGTEAPTTVFKIHYSNDGIHIVPDYPSKKRSRK